MEQYELPFNKYEDPTVELDFEPEEIYCEVCDCHYDADDPCPFH